MKTNLVYLACLCLTLTSACKKETTQQTPPDTTLEIRVNDELGNKVSGATVALLDDEDLTQIGVSQTTDVNGVVTFKNLKARKYAWAVVKGCKNNANGSGISASPLTANINNTVTTVISGTGTISLYNNSTNPYHVYVNGELTISSMQGGTTEILQFKPTGNYTIRILQVSGYVFDPTDITYTGNLQCGGTLVASFPTKIPIMFSNFLLDLVDELVVLALMGLTTVIIRTVRARKRDHQRKEKIAYEIRKRLNLKTSGSNG